MHAKLIIFGVICFLLTSLYYPTSAFIEQDLFFDGFESGNFNNWDSCGSGWEIRDRRYRHSGTYGAYIESVVSSSDLSKSISTIGHSNISFTYWYKTSGRWLVGDIVDVDWYDGSSWMTLFEHNGGNDVEDWERVSLDLPEEANNNPSFMVRFRVTLHREGIYFNIDDISLAGEINQPPIANYSWSSDGLEAFFQDESNDSDGYITSWNWDFGDGYGSSLQNPSHEYPDFGIYNVTLTVTDDDEASDSVSYYISINETHNERPVVYEEYPVNDSMGVVRPPLELNATVEDPNGDIMDVYIKWIRHDYYHVGEEVTLQTYIGVGNGTYNFVPPEINDWVWGDTTYFWSVNATDGTLWTNETYEYTTSGSRYDVSNNDLVNFQDAGLVWVHRTSEVDYDGLYDVNGDGQVNFQDAGLTWVNRD